MTREKEEKRRKRLTPAARAEEDRNKYLLTDLAYNFANKATDLENETEIIGFNYLRSDDGKKPPLLLDLRTSGALGVISNDVMISHGFIKHVIFELAYYHAPEDLQFVFFFDREECVAKQEQIFEDQRGKTKNVILSKAKNLKI